MLIMSERFQDFLKENNEDGIEIYERMNTKTRRRVTRLMKNYREVLRLRHYIEIGNIKGNIKNGDPKKDPILQLSDFFAYATWIRSSSKYKLINQRKNLKCIIGEITVANDVLKKTLEGVK